MIAGEISREFRINDQYNVTIKPWGEGAMLLLNERMVTIEELAAVLNVTAGNVSKFLLGKEKAKTNNATFLETDYITVTTKFRCLIGYSKNKMKGVA